MDGNSIDAVAKVLSDVFSKQNVVSSLICVAGTIGIPVLSCRYDKREELFLTAEQLYNDHLLPEKPTFMNVNRLNKQYVIIRYF